MPPGPPLPPPPEKIFEETPEHTNIFAAIESRSHCNAMIDAVAGSGKTTTVIKGMRRVPKGKKIGFFVFNKRNAVEIQPKLPPNATACTLNSLGHNGWTTYARANGLPSPKINAYKTVDIVRDVIAADDNADDTTYRSYGSAVLKLARFGKAYGIIPDSARTLRGPGYASLAPSLRPDTPETWEHLVDFHAIQLIEGDDKGGKRAKGRVATLTDLERVVGYARGVLRAGLKETAVIDFDDQLYMTYAYNAPVKQYDRIFLDETQDLNQLQKELVVRAMAPGARIVAVGDECQAIYGWRGADADSMANMQKQFDMVELPLHVSYRCPQAVVAVARRYVPHIKSHPSAPMGTVIEVAKPLTDVSVLVGDMVVCRTNAPLVKACYGLIRRRIPATVLGRNIATELLSLVKTLSSSIKDNELPLFNEELDTWEQSEIRRLSSKENTEDKIAAVQDRAETVRVFIEMSKNIPEITRNIGDMFSDRKEGEAAANVVTLCTVHKAKGLEADRVFILDFDQMPSKWAKKPWMKIQENNLIYVAVTRAKKHLQMVTN